MQSIKSINLEDKDYLTLPQTPGVYIFKHEEKPIYVGKAKNLKSRVSSYFGKSLGPKTRAMVDMADKLSFIPVDNEFEALLLEANLVKKHKPKYNIELRDDKSPLYIAITKEEFPRVLALRQTHLSKYKLKYFFGPYVSGASVKEILFKLRKAIPFAGHIPGKRSCLRHEIGLCNPCPTVHSTEEDRKLYNLNIRKLKNVLSGKIKETLTDLHREMKIYSDAQEFEEARNIHKQIKSLEYLTQKYDTNIGQYLKNPNLLEEIRRQELEELKGYINEFYPLPNLSRIECFDIAHLAGSQPTASMVTFVNGEPDKNFYRQFKVNQKKSQSDLDSMKEILTRRANHFRDWGEPDLIIVDGGKGQIKVAKEIFGNVPVVGLAKRFETLVFLANEQYYERKVRRGGAKNLIQRIRDEAHRFARRYHHKLISKELLK